MPPLFTRYISRPRGMLSKYQLIATKWRQSVSLNDPTTIRSTRELVPWSDSSRSSERNGKSAVSRWSSSHRPRPLCVTYEMVKCAYAMEIYYSLYYSFWKYYIYPILHNFSFGYWSWNIICKNKKVEFEIRAHLISFIKLIGKVHVSRIKSITFFTTWILMLYYLLLGNCIVSNIFFSILFHQLKSKWGQIFLIFFFHLQLNALTICKNYNV